MSEADYMDDCQMVDLYDYLNSKPPEYEVVLNGEVKFEGERSECWHFRNCYGGYVQKKTTGV